MRILPATLDLGAALLAVPTTGTVSIVNDGLAPWDPAEAPSLGGADAAAFAISEPCALPLAPSVLCTIAVTFTAVEARPHSAELRIPSDPAVVVPITATVRGVRFTPASIDFGGVQPGDSVSASVAIENVGVEVVEVPLSVEGAGFALNGGARAVPLGAGESVSVQLTFTPSTVGAVSGRLVADLCEDDGCDPAAELSGMGALPVLAIAPTPVDFGAVAADSTADATVTLQNAGGAPLAVSAIALSDPSGFTSISAAPTLPTTIEPGASTTVTLRYAPTQGMAALDAELSVASDDPATPNATVPVIGSTPGPGLVATPPAVDFGTLDEGEALEIDVSVRSSGTAAVTIDAIALDAGTGFSIVGALPPLPASVAVNDTLTVRVRASAGPNDLGGRDDVLRFTLQGAGDRAVPLSFAGGVSGCVPTLTQAFVDISNVALGTTESAGVYVSNAGTTPCVLASAVPAPDLTFPPELTFDAAGLASIAPGGTGVLSFSATLTTEEQVAGSVDVTFQNVASMRLTAFAAGVIPTLFSEIDGVDLGILPAGCLFGEQAVVLENTGATNQIITAIEIVPPGSPFVVLDAPGPLPAGVEAGKKEVIIVGRVAAPEGSYQASLVIRGSANVVRVPLAMEVSAPGTPITQRYLAPSAAMLDVLFIIDNSGSMYDDQEELATNFPLFMAQPQFNDGSIDLHLGVTTTDCDFGGEEGVLIGDPLVVTSDTPNMASAFADNARVGTSGSGDEKGLLAMQLALSPPNVPGINDAFYRPEAALAVVIVSDEPDFSPSTPQPYIDFLRGVKGGGLAEGLVGLSAVLDGTYGTDYITAVAAFGGMTLDINTSWGSQLGALADGLADLPQIFRLGDAPTAGVAVTVDGVPAVGVTLDAPNKMFALGTKAPVGSLIEVVYNGACSPP
ncbi:MAG: hypothetical protein A2138_06405 [Deltaproteobacteria bacterium RBG_16_71_12]|nr:MAG: hypothetical protein A2138_06405 [Deltaproteobacteria bacterium RBG_16_71_12]